MSFSALQAEKPGPEALAEQVAAAMPAFDGEERRLAAGRMWAASRPDALLVTLADGFELGRLVDVAKYGETLDLCREVA